MAFGFGQRRGSRGGLLHVLGRYIGLQEAYNSSVLLLASTFGLDALEDSDFAKQRHTSEEEMLLCKGYRRRAVASDPTGTSY